MRIALVLLLAACAATYVLADTKHSLPGEAPRRCAAEIRAFLADGGDGRARVVDDSFGRARGAVTVSAAP